MIIKKEVTIEKWVPGSDDIEAEISYNGRPVIKVFLDTEDIDDLDPVRQEDFTLDELYAVKSVDLAKAAQEGLEALESQRPEVGIEWAREIAKALRDVADMFDAYAARPGPSVSGSPDDSGSG